jgi:hypothetical protein
LFDCCGRPDCGCSDFITIDSVIGMSTACRWRPWPDEASDLRFYIVYLKLKSISGGYVQLPKDQDCSEEKELVVVQAHPPCGWNSQRTERMNPSSRCTGDDFDSQIEDRRLLLPFSAIKKQQLYVPEVVSLYLAILTVSNDLPDPIERYGIGLNSY